MNDLRQVAAPGLWSVDVILPTRNRKKYLAGCIASIERQTYQPNSVIVVDDGSDDGSVAMLEEMARRWDRLVVIPTPPRGVSAARNTALAASTSELVAFIDSDDEWDATKLEKQVELFAAKPTLGLVYSGYRRVGEDGAAIGRPDVVAEKRGWIFDDLLHRFYGIAPSTMLVRRQLMAGIGGFDESLVQAEDRDVCLKLARISEIDCISAPLVSFRIHEQSSYEHAIRHDPEFVLMQRIRVWNAWSSDMGDGKAILRRFRREAIAAAPILSFLRPRTGLYHRLRQSEMALARRLFPRPWNYFWPALRRPKLFRPDIAKDFIARRLVAPFPPLLRLAHRWGRLKNLPISKPGARR